MAVRVAVVGAGPLGVMAVKNLKEDGFDVTAFDRRPQIGGLWQGCHDTYVSVTASTVFNSSRFMSAISDFPYLPHHDDYPTAAQLIEYVNAYVDHFGIRQQIHLNTEVVGLRRIDQKWEIKTASHGSPLQVDYFDKVLISTGSFLTPRYPTIQGIEHFQGKKVHSVDYSDPVAFQGENVLVVGLHATAQDVTKELSKHASKVYISHRRGVVMVRVHFRFYATRLTDVLRSLVSRKMGERTTKS
jgi:dimethylaniline monooxygenase (N-oxide forming)